METEVATGLLLTVFFLRLTRASARALSASRDCRKIFSASIGRFGGRSAAAPYGERPGAGILRPGLFSLDGPVLRGMPLERRRPI